MQTEQQFRELLDRYLSGNCTPEEKNIIEKWFEQGGNAGKEDLLLNAADKARLLSNIHRLQKHKPAAGKKIFLLQPGWRAAAVWAGIVIIAGLGLWRSGITKNRMVEQAAATDFIEIRTNIGELRRVVLPDSSVVLLNANSTLGYHPRFSQQRQVRLSGEAFFTVVHDEAHPFTVLTKDSLSTAVLGTSFNIRSYPEADEINVMVVSGRVRVNKANNPLGILTRQQAIAYNKSAGTFKQFNAVNTQSLTNWTVGQWEYDHCRLSDLAVLLQNQYGVKVTLNNKRNKPKIDMSVNFTRQQSPKEIMEVFCSLAGCRYRFIHEKEIEVY